MEKSRINGLIAAPFTPLHPDGSLNMQCIPEYHALLVKNKISGAFICGSTGEGASLTLDEKMKVAEAWAQCNKPNKELYIMQLVGGTCVSDCITLAKHASSVGVDAVSFVAPYYFKPANVDVLAACCAEIAAAVPDLPFYFYHIPTLSGVNLPMIELLKKVDGFIPNFAGIKYTHEDFMDFLSCLQFKNGKYNLLWGRDECMLSALVIGAKGAIGSTFNYAAPLYHQLMDAFNKQDLPEATRLQQKAIDMIELLGKYGGIATGKSFMKLIGMDCGTFRLPVRNMSNEAFESFRFDAKKIGFDQICSSQVEKHTILNEYV